MEKQIAARVHHQRAERFCFVLVGQKAVESNSCTRYDTRIPGITQQYRYRCTWYVVSRRWLRFFSREKHWMEQNSPHTTSVFIDTHLARSKPAACSDPLTGMKALLESFLTCIVSCVSLSAMAGPDDKLQNATGHRTSLVLAATAALITTRPTLIHLKFFRRNRFSDFIQSTRNRVLSYRPVGSVVGLGV